MDQAVFGRWVSGRMPGAPPVEALAAALRGSSLGPGAGAASGIGLDVAGLEPEFAVAPESGFSSMRTKY